MYCRVMKKEEFVERMLANQELRRERRRRDMIEYIQYCKTRRLKLEHRKYLREKCK